MRPRSNLAPNFIRFVKAHWILLAAFSFTVSMQSIMMLLPELGSQITKAGFDESQWTYHRTGVLIEAIPSVVFWHYIQQHSVQVSLSFGGYMGLLLGLQLPMVVMNLALGRRRKLQHYFTLMLWAWPIATPFVAFQIYRHQTPTRQQFLRYLGLGLGLIGLGIFAFAPQLVLQFIGYCLVCPIAAISFMIGGVMFALIYTFTVPFGAIGMSGEVEREGLSYGLAVIGYFELFWFGWFITQRFHRLKP
jgi:hypothetical protein